MSHSVSTALQDSKAMLSEPLPELNLSNMVRRLGKFYIKNGEFSDVWLGEWLDESKKKQFGEKVAIKQLRGAPAHNRELHAETTKKLNKSGLEWIKLDHDNVLKFHGILYDMGYLPAIVTTYCDIGNVLEFISKDEPGFSELLFIILGIACGLQYLHSKQIVHGDLRAANVLIDSDKKPVIADYGLTFVIDHGEFTTNKIAGPARWTAPEILDPPGDENDPPYSQASDIFAFGMTMIEILTGKPPYSWIRNDSAVIFKILRGERPDMPENIAESKDIKDMIGSTWEKDPDQRPSALQIRQILEKHIKGEMSPEGPNSYNPFRIAIYYLRRFFGGHDEGGAP